MFRIIENVAGGIPPRKEEKFWEGYIIAATVNFQTMFIQ